MRSLAAAHASQRSSAARVFGATVSLGPAPGRGLCLVVGRDADPSALVEAAGGGVVARLDRRRLLAVTEWDALQDLARHPDIALAGGVQVDADRFAAFCALAGIDTGNEQATSASSAREE